MAMSRRIGWWLLVAGLWAGTVDAQEMPEPVVLTVFGTNYTARDLGVEAESPPDLLVARTLLKVQTGIMGSYYEKLDYEPTEDELKEYCRRSAPTPEDMEAVFGPDRPSSLSAEQIFETFWQDWQREADDPHGPMRLAAEQLKKWKVSRALFDRYGGRVYVDAFLVPGVPEASLAYLAEREAAGDFAIRDAELRARFWERLRAPSPVPLVSEEEGRVALAEHPADRQRRQAADSLRERMNKTRSPAP